MKDFPEYVYTGEKEKEGKNLETEIEKYLRTIDDSVIETLEESGKGSDSGIKRYKIIELVKWKVPASERQIIESLDRLADEEKIVMMDMLTYKIR